MSQTNESSIPDVRRLRMFAGPNGSGKTTVKFGLRRPPEWFGIYINPDDLEQAIRESGFLAMAPYKLTITSAEVREHFLSSALLRSRGLDIAAPGIECSEDRLEFRGLEFNSYHASVLADFLRRKALAERRSFSLETVMSAADKVDLLQQARMLGYRTYLYYIAPEDPAINIQRVKYRAAAGGHDVPEAKIVARYHRSLGLLTDAILHTNRAFFFDTSGTEAWYFAEITEGTRVELKSGEMPNWFRHVWEHLRGK